MCVCVCMRVCVCVYGLLIDFRMFCSIFVDHIPHWRQQLEERASSTSALMHRSSHCIGCVHLVHLSSAAKCSSLIPLTPSPPPTGVSHAPDAQAAVAAASSPAAILLTAIVASAVMYIALT